MNAKAQQYVPFPDSNAYWSEYYSNYGFPNYKYTYFIRGDTILDSLSYHKLYSDDSASTISYIGGLRENNKKVYLFYSHCTFNILLYDFNLNVGDSMRLSCLEACDSTVGEFYIKVTSVDSVLLEDMTYRKRINYNNIGSPWIEGIGSMDGLLYPYYSCSTCMCFFESVCFKQNDTTLYINTNDYNVSCFNYITSINEMTNNDLITISPNPASSEITVSGRQEAVGSIDVYNTLGEKVYTSPITDNRSPITVNIAALPTGMYFAEIGTAKGKVEKKFVKE